MIRIRRCSHEKIGCVAALALIGWYFMVPPILHDHLGPHGRDALSLPDSDAPLSKWSIFGSFDTAAECDKFQFIDGSERLRLGGVQFIECHEIGLISNRPEDIENAQLLGPRAENVTGNTDPTGEKLLKLQRDWEKAHGPLPKVVRPSPELEAELARAAETYDSPDAPYDKMIRHWTFDDHIPIQQVGSQLEDGKTVVIVIGIVGGASQWAKDIIWHDLGPEHKMGEWPVRIYGLVPGKEGTGR
jgi:hypothetical protein